MNKQKIRDKSGRDNTGIRLVEKSKRGILHVLFGRTMLILVLFAVQLLLLYMAFRSLRRFIPYIYGLLMVFYGVIIVRLVNKPSDASSKITWILLIVLLPPVGVALYLFAEFDLGHRMLNRRLSELITRTEPMLPDQSALRNRLKQENPDIGAISEYMWTHGRFSTYENTQVEYLPSGEAALEAILREIDKAEKFIFMEFFIVDEGVMWGRILEKLEEKVAQGVEVRLLYDGTCALFRLPYNYPQMLEQLGIKCKMFSPLRPLMSTHYNNRDHRKILVIDGKVAFTGGVNLADEYINRKAALRPLEGRGGAVAGRGGARLHADVFANVEPGRARGALLPLSQCGSARRARPGLGDALRRQPAGRRARGRDGLSGHHQPRPALRAHHDALPDPGQRNAPRR